MDKKELKKYGLTELESYFEELPPEYLESLPKGAVDLAFEEEMKGKIEKWKAEARSKK